MQQINGASKKQQIHGAPEKQQSHGAASPEKIEMNSDSNLKNK